MSGGGIRLIQEAFESNYIAPLGPMVHVFEQEFSVLWELNIVLPCRVERRPCTWLCGIWE